MSAARELERLVGRVLVASLPGPELDSERERELEDLAPVGLIFFGRHLVDEDQWSRLARELRRLAPGALFLVDQEGGRVDRIKTFVGPCPAPGRLAAAGVEEMSRAADCTVRALRQLDFDFNCAPVLDLDEGLGEENLLGDRCLGADADALEPLARVVLEAHARHGILSCIKHFPGLGRTRLDTHAGRALVEASESSLREREIEPFRRLLDSTDSVMVSHAAYPALSGEDRPASLCPKIVTGLLREELGHEGPVLTDDLGMGAVLDRAVDERAVEAIRAGADLLLYCADVVQALEARERLASEAGADPRFRRRLEESAQRIVGLQRRRDARPGLPAGESLGGLRSELEDLQGRLA